MSNSRTNVELLKNLLLSLGGSSTAQIDALLELIGSTPTITGDITLGASTSDDINILGTMTGRAASDVWVPVLTNTTNITSSTLNSAWFSRQNDIVFFGVNVTIDPNASSTQSLLKISLPVASNFTATTDVVGNAVSIINITAAGPIAFVNADTGNDVINVQFVSDSGGTTAGWNVTGSYLIRT